MENKGLFGQPKKEDNKEPSSQPNSGFGGFVGFNKPAQQNTQSGIDMSKGFGGSQTAPSNGLFGSKTTQPLSGFDPSKGFGDIPKT